VTEVRQESAVGRAGWPVAHENLSIRDSACEFSILRLWRPSPELYDSLAREFALAWPVQPNTMVAGGVSVLWLGPREWAIIGLGGADVAARAARACGPTMHHCADVGDGRVRFDLSGTHARTLLSKGCSLDLHPRAFGPQACAQSLLAQVPVLIAAASGAAPVPGWRLWADASLAHYLRSWFIDATLEFGAG
jgi:sarcosine oxidase subunit gamma